MPWKQEVWVQIPPEAPRFSLKRGKWVVSGAVVLYVIVYPPF